MGLVRGDSLGGVDGAGLPVRRRGSGRAAHTSGRGVLWPGPVRAGGDWRQPLAPLHFGSNGGDGIVVLTGTAEILNDLTAPDDTAWLVRFGRAIDARFGDPVNFAETCSVPVRIGLTRVGGF